MSAGFDPSDLRARASAGGGGTSARTATTCNESARARNRAQGHSPIFRPSTLAQYKLGISMTDPETSPTRICSITGANPKWHSGDERRRLVRRWAHYRLLILAILVICVSSGIVFRDSEPLFNPIPATWRNIFMKKMNLCAGLIASVVRKLTCARDANP